MASEPAFQDLIPHNGCWGCGPRNEHGLQVKSYWHGDEAVCTWRPAPWHSAGPPDVLNGGIIATIVDCHTVCTAIAALYRAEGRPIDSEPPIWCVTASLQVTYLKPTRIHAPVELRARVREMGRRKVLVDCTLLSEDKERARAEVVAVRVGEAWSAAPRM